MDFEPAYTEEQERFRQEVRTWLAENVPANLVRSPDPRDHTAEQHGLRRELGRKLGARGWLYPTMPKEYGGGGLSLDHAVIIEEELDNLELALPPYYDSGGRLGGPTILVWGTEEQKRHFLPPIFTGQVKTWQLLTEPEAGSDLAGVLTLAVRDGDDYVLNGQKTMVGSDHGADQFWTIVVTDPQAPRHQNVSWFMIPADLPGITVVPLELLASGGERGTPSDHKNSVYFDNVRVPAFNLIGGENNGWRAASTHLELEHGGGGNLGRNWPIERFFAYCKQATLDGRPLIEDPDARDRMVDVFVEAEINRLFGLRNFYLAHAKKPRSYEGPQASYYRKLSGLRMAQAIHDVLGESALTNDPEWGAADGWIEANMRVAIMALHPGGTADIQKLIMARRIGIGRAVREEAGTLA